MRDISFNRTIEEYAADALKLSEYFGVQMSRERALEIAKARYAKEHESDAVNGGEALEQGQSAAPQAQTEERR